MPQLGNNFYQQQFSGRQYLRQEQHKKRELRPQKKTMCEICGKLVITSLSEVTFLYGLYF